MKYRKMLIPGIVAVMIVGFSLAATAGGFHGGGRVMDMGKGFMGSFRDLDLTDAQKRAVAEVLLRYRDVFQTTIGYLMTARQNLSAAVLADPMVEADVRRVSRDVAYVQEELSVLKAKAAAEILPLLASDQAEQLLQNRTDRQERMAERMDKMSERFDKMLEEWLAFEP